MTVKGMERVNRRSYRTKLKMKMFLAVLISFLQINAHSGQEPKLGLMNCLKSSDGVQMTRATVET